MTDRERERQSENALGNEAPVSAEKWKAIVPDGRVTITVSNRRLVPDGTLNWYYQKKAAPIVVQLSGVAAVTNSITVRPHLLAADVRAQIEAAFERSAAIDARRVSVSANAVGLSGHVGT